DSDVLPTPAEPHYPHGEGHRQRESLQSTAMIGVDGGLSTFSLPTERRGETQCRQDVRALRLWSEALDRPLKGGALRALDDGEMWLTSHPDDAHNLSVGQVVGKAAGTRLGDRESTGRNVP